MYAKRYSLGRIVLSLSGTLITLISVFFLLQPPVQAAQLRASLVVNSGNSMSVALNAAQFEAPVEDRSVPLESSPGAGKMVVGYSGTLTPGIISAGGFHTCRVAPDSTLLCWGWNGYGQSTPPTGTFPEVSAGYWHTCGVRGDNTLACWGSNIYGQAMPPTGTFLHVSSGGYMFTCGLRTDNTLVCWGDNSFGQASPPTGTFAYLSAGYNHGCALRADGTVACWGYNAAGQATPPTDTFTQISAGYNHNCGLRTDGRLICWGTNFYGESNVPAGTFVQVAGGDWFTCGLKSDGTVSCWGLNDYGQTSTPPGIFDQVSAGHQHACGLKRNGTVACWGRNWEGQAPFIVLNPSSLVTGQVGFAYRQTLNATGGTVPYTFTVEAGNLPPGLSLREAGEISGTPTSVGTWNVNIATTDRNAFQAERAYTLTIDYALALHIQKSVVPTLAVPGQFVTYTIAYSNAGPQTAQGVILTDVMPLALTNVTYSNSGALITPTGDLSYTWQVTDLAPGNAGFITITGVISAPLFPALVLTNTALIDTSTPGADPTHHTAQAAVTTCSTIQCAIDLAPPGSTLLIPSGTYTESLTLNKPVSLTGVSSATVIIHAVTGQRVLTITGSAISNTVIISDLTLAGGSASNGYIGPDLCGGGIFIGGAAKPLIQHVSLTDNYAGYEGGGVYADSTSVLIMTDVQLINNTSGVYGGGAYAGGAAVLTGNRFENNHCTWPSCAGGGLSTWSNLTVSGTVFVNNFGSNGGGGAAIQQGGTIINSRFDTNRCVNSACLGGGLAANGTLTLINTEFISNTASAGGGLYTGGAATVIGGRFLQNQATAYGGGLWANYGSLTINGTEFLSNTAATEGGGLLARVTTNLMNARLVGNIVGGRGGGVAHIPTSGSPAIQIVNSLFADNLADTQGAGLYLASTGQAQILNSTFANLIPNTSQAIVILNGSVGVTNTIITSYTIGISRTAGTVAEDYNLFFGNNLNLTGTITGGAHDILADPLFVEPSASDYHLAGDSAAIDAGVNVGVVTDFDGDARDVLPDLGFDEFINTPITNLNAQTSRPTLLGQETVLSATASGTHIQYQWNFGDGSPTMNGRLVNHLYQTAGIYTATVTAMNGLGAVSALARVTVTTDIPILGLSASNSSPTLIGNTTILTAQVAAGTNVTYHWSFGDGLFGDQSIVTHTYIAVGIYTALVTASNSVSVVTATANVEVVDVPIDGLSATNDSPTILGQSTTLTATLTSGSQVVYTWDFGDGATTIGQVVTHTYILTGVYTAVVTATNGSGSATATTPVTITNLAPFADAGPDQAVIVSSPVDLDGSGSYDQDGHVPLTYQWAQTGGPAVLLNSTTISRPTFTAPTTPCILTFSLRVMDTYGASSLTNEVLIRVTDQPIAGLIVSNTGPERVGTPLSFTAQISAGTNVNYEWNFGDGVIFGPTSLNQITHTYSTYGQFTAIITATNSVNSSVKTLIVVIMPYQIHLPLIAKNP